MTYNYIINWATFIFVTEFESLVTLYNTVHKHVSSYEGTSEEWSNK